MPAIPLILMEEHHEAFLAWNHAALRKVIPAEKNTLLHVDDHSDLQLPVLRTPIRDAVADPEKMAAFTYSELSVGSFLYPALYLGLFNRMYWLRRQHDKDAEKSEIRCVSSAGENGKCLRSSEVFSLTEALHPDRKCFRLHYIVAEDSMAQEEGSTVLDIDLDYFSCRNSQGEYWEVEITEAAYREYMENRYHKLRLAAGGMVRVEERNGSYYLCSNTEHEAAEESETDIGARIDSFLQFLERCRVYPALIDVARSRRSGYTTDMHAARIEKHIIESLTRRYDARILQLEEWITSLK